MLTDDIFDLEKSYEYILSIQVSLGGFSFSVVSAETNKLLAFEHTPLKISNDKFIARRFSEWAGSLEIFQKPFKKYKVIVFDEKFTLVPEKFISKKIKREIPRLLFSKNENPEIAENYIRHKHTKLIFALPPGLNEAIKEVSEEYEIIHPVKIIIEQLPETKRNGLILLFDSKILYIVIYSDGTLLMANSFRVNHTNDVIYYVLTVLKQLNIKPDSTESYFAGSVSPDDETIHQLSKYLGPLKGLPNKKQIEFNQNVFTVPATQNLSIYA